MTSTISAIVTAHEGAVRDVLNRIVAAWKDNDADAFAAFYAEDATVVLPGGAFLKGRDEIRNYMATAFGGPFKGSASMDTQESVRFLGDDARW